MHCESGDVLIDDVALPSPRRGDLLAIPATGAYTLAMSSNYNGVPRPAAVLVARRRRAGHPPPRDDREPAGPRSCRRSRLKRSLASGMVGVADGNEDKGERWLVRSSWRTSSASWRASLPSTGSCKRHGRARSRRAGVAGLGLAGIGRLTQTARAAAPATHRRGRSGPRRPDVRLPPRAGGLPSAACTKPPIASAAGAGRGVASSTRVRSTSTAASSSTRATRRSASSRRSSASLWTTSSRPRSTAPSRCTTSTASRTRTPRRRPTSRRSGRSSTRTCRPRATRRCSTASRSAAFELDQMSITEYLDETIADGGASSKLGQLLEHRVQHRVRRPRRTSRARSTCSTSSRYSGQGQLRIFGPSNEKYHVRGGNDQITARMGDRLAGQITTGSELVAVREDGGRRLRAHIQAGERHEDRHGGQGRTRASVLDPPQLGQSLEGRFLGAEAARRSQSRAWAPTRSSTSSSRGVTGTTSG